MKEFQTFCEQKIRFHAEAIFTTKDFLSCSFNVLKHILELDAFKWDESVVLGACLDWAQFACQQNGKDPNDAENVRCYLKDESDSVNLLHMIRYRSMKHEDFVIRMNEIDGLFSDVKDYEDVMRLMSGSKDLKTGKFSTKLRNPFEEVAWDESKAIDCNVSDSMNKKCFQVLDMLLLRMTKVLTSDFAGRFLSWTNQTRSIK